MIFASDLLADDIQSARFLGVLRSREQIHYFYSAFDDLFRGFNRTNRLLLTCFLENLLKKWPVHDMHLTPTLIHKAAKDSSFSQVDFTPGLYYVPLSGSWMRRATVTDCEVTNFKDSTLLISKILMTRSESC
jgi:hypothetical protein